MQKNMDIIAVFAAENVFQKESWRANNFPTRNDKPSDNIKNNN